MLSFAWSVFLGALGATASYVLWEMSLARSGDLRVSSDGGLTSHFTTPLEQLYSTLSMLPLIILGTIGAAVGFVGLGQFLYYALAKRQSGAQLPIMLWLGLCPAHCLVFFGIYPMVVAAVSIYTVRRYPGVVPRIIEFVVTLTLALPWYFFRSSTSFSGQ